MHCAKINETFSHQSEIPSRKIDGPPMDFSEYRPTSDPGGWVWVVTDELFTVPSHISILQIPMTNDNERRSGRGGFQSDEIDDHLLLVPWHVSIHVGAIRSPKLKGLILFAKMKKPGYVLFSCSTSL